MKTKTIIKDQNGASAVEFAIILPLLILVIFGIIEISLLLYNKQVITNAAREGARLGVIVQAPRVSNTAIEGEIKNYAQNHLVTFGSEKLEIVIASEDDGDDDNGVCVCSNPDPATDERCLTFGCDLEVEVTYDYEFLVLNNPITKIWGGIGPIKLKATSTMRME